jgi:protein SMG6
MDLFVRLHGMLFTRIQLDDLPTVMSRFLERLEEDASLDGVSRKATITQVDWMLMATTNITALLQYGSGLGIIRKALAQEGAERRRQHASAAGEEGEEEDGRISPESDGHHQSPSMDSPLEPTLSFSSALDLSYAILNHCLHHPRRLQGMTHVLNPYISLSLTFMATLFRQSHIGNIISTGLPWVQLVDFFNTCPEDIREEARLINGAPLPEDWCIRGMEWVGRRVYERGFWKAKGSGRGSGAMAQPKLGERFSSEMDVLLANFDSAVDTNEGVVDEIDGTDLTDGPVAVNQRRWRRVAWAAGVLVKHVDGLQLVDGKVVIRGVLADRLAELEAERLAKLDLADTPAPVRVEEEEIELESEDEGEDPDLAVLRVCPSYLFKHKADIPGTSPTSPFTRQYQYYYHSYQDQEHPQTSPTSHSRLHDACIRYQRPLVIFIPILQIGRIGNMVHSSPFTGRHRTGRTIKRTSPPRSIRKTGYSIPRIPYSNTFSMSKDPNY